MDETPVLGSFSSAPLDPALVRVADINGVERLGQLYEFRVRFWHIHGPLTDSQLNAVLLAPCAFALGPEDDDIVKGIARQIEVIDAAEDRTSLYEVIVVPTVWLLTVSNMSRVHQKMSVKDMAQDVLTRYSLSAGEHFDLRILKSDKRDYCVQYHESDWDFVQRWFEQEGCFYWFEHSDRGETLVVADDNSAVKPIPGDSSLPYRDLGGLNRPTESVFQWRGVQKRIPARVVLKDYNEQKPLLQLAVKAEVKAKGGFGTYFEYGDNFEIPQAGQALAERRAEYLLASRQTFFGETDSSRFHVGHWFALTEHFENAQNRQYLITAIEHRLSPLQSDGSTKALGYRARFEAIPLSVAYRPERKTPWPSIHGLMHGHIDSDSSGDYSTLDKQGRYRVRFPFDAAAKKGEACSMWVRMAQSYAGSGYGSHFPLHKGTEVLVAFYDGDPDRPVIVGCLPNMLTPGPSTAVNATQSGHKTASGIQVIMDDSLAHHGE